MIQTGRKSYLEDRENNQNYQNYQKQRELYQSHNKSNIISDPNIKSGLKPKNEQEAKIEQQFKNKQILTPQPHQFNTHQKLSNFNYKTYQKEIESTPYQKISQQTPVGNKIECQQSYTNMQTTPQNQLNGRNSYITLPQPHNTPQNKADNQQKPRDSFQSFIETPMGNVSNIKNQQEVKKQENRKTSIQNRKKNNYKFLWSVLIAVIFSMLLMKISFKNVNAQHTPNNNNVNRQNNYEYSQGFNIKQKEEEGEENQQQPRQNTEDTNQYINHEYEGYEQLEIQETRNQDNVQNDQEQQIEYNQENTNRILELLSQQIYDDLLSYLHVNNEFDYVDFISQLQSSYSKSAIGGILPLVEDLIKDSQYIDMVEKDESIVFKINF